MKDTSTFLSYNVQDYEISNLLTFLIPNYNFTEVEFASVLYLELKLDERCLSNSLNTQVCFTIRFMYNGQFLDIKNGKLYANSDFYTTISRLYAGDNG